MNALPRRVLLVPLLLLAGCATHPVSPEEPVAPVVTPAPAETAPSTEAVQPRPVADANAVAPAPVAPAGKATAAEDDFAALYGTAATPTTTNAGEPTASAQQAFDPWQRYNRRVHHFNNGLDAHVLRPVALAYVKVVPAPLRNGVGNFFRNLGQPVSVVNALLQGKPAQSADSLFRFLVNSTFGIAGILDPATALNIPGKNEDFGQTLATWGWHRSRYVELPVFGPRTVRDVFGMVGDAPLNPLRQVHAEAGPQAAVQFLEVVNIRTNLLSTDSLRAGAEDDYSLYRDAWLQRRNYQIFGEDAEDADGVDGTLPNYLLTAPVPRAEMGPVRKSMHRLLKKLHIKDEGESTPTPQE